ncbi:MAG: glycosyltransferase family 4 protein [Gemmatimonadales bacterium]
MIATQTLHTLQLGKGWFPEQSGGLNRYYHELLRHLPATGVEVTGLVAGSHGVTTQSAGVVRAFAPSEASLAARFSQVRHEVARALRDHPGSVVASHFALYAAPCIDLLREHPVVVHFHGPWARESRTEGAGRLATGLKYCLERLVYRQGSRFVVLSHAFGRLLAEEHGVDPGRIDVIPGGVDTARFAPEHTRDEARRRLDWPGDRPVALVVRRLVRRMGLEDLVEAVRRARRAVPDLLVIIAGSGPLRGELAHRAADLADHVRLVGYLPDADLPLAFRAADFSIVPSVALEGFGLIVAESLAAGTPVLVTDVGGLPETLAGFAEACIIRDRSPLGMAAALADAVQGRLPLPSADACVRHARQRFDWTVIAAQVRDSYMEVAG